MTLHRCYWRCCSSGNWVNTAGQCEESKYVNRFSLALICRDLCNVGRNAWPCDALFAVVVIDPEDDSLALNEIFPVTDRIVASS